MIAEITFTGASVSYTIGATKFHQGRMVVIHDARTIVNCQNTVGFHVNMLKDSGPEKRVVRPVATKAAPKEEAKLEAPVMPKASAKKVTTTKKKFGKKSAK